MLTRSTVSRPKSLRIAKCASSPHASSHLQARAFRFGVWVSCLDPAFQRDLRCRHRKLKYKYIDALNRKLSWHDHPFAEEPKAALRRLIAQYSSPTSGRQHSFWVNQDELNRRTSQCKPSPSTLDRWQDQLRRYTQTDTYEDSARRSQAGSVTEDSDVKSKAQADHSNSGVTRASNASVNPLYQDYVIDPITNRKVLKSDYELVDEDLEPGSQTFKSYRSQFAPWSPPAVENNRPPVHSNGKPPVAELDKYAEKNFDDWTPADTHLDLGNPDASSHAESKLYRFEDLSSRSEECGLNHLPAEDPIDTTNDLHRYQPSAPDATAEPQFDGLRNQSIYDSPSLSNHHHIAKQSTSLPPELQDELSKYKAFIHEETIAEQDSPEPLPDLEQYQKFTPDEAVSRPSKEVDHDDTYSYRHTSFGDDVSIHDQPFEQYGDLEKYESFKLRDLDSAAQLERDIVAESLREFDAKEQKENAREVIDDFDFESQDVLPKMELPKNHVFSKHYSDDAQPPAIGRESHDVVELEIQMRELSAASDAIDQEANANLQKSWRNEPFPDETNVAGLNSVFDHNTQARTLSEENVMPQNTSAVISKDIIQPALERQQSSRSVPNSIRGATSVTGEHAADLFSRETQGLETSFSEECGGRSTMPVYTRTYSSGRGQATTKSESSEAHDTPPVAQYSSPDCYHRDPEIDGLPPSMGKPTRESETASMEQPTVYKILAYDPSMQTVNIAETSSVVPDQASPLSPTEVLLRLSNPTKFFPHFAPLKAEGFEIVSGSGDVLVFRQMRPAKAASASGGASINPIDMMGRATSLPNAAAFASPTGFVNYDVPRVEEETTEPAFRSNIDVRREEPVFSGTRSSWFDGKKPKKAKRRVVSRMLVAGAWVAGLTYAIGVVSEFFTTGGSSGGPHGFAPN